jgi:hypothetical protein
MRAVVEHLVVEQDGYLALGGLPVQAGGRVTVIVLIPDVQPASRHQYPLRGTLPYRFDNPTAPVAPDHWE